MCETRWVTYHLAYQALPYAAVRHRAIRLGERVLGHREGKKEKKRYD